ncbi:MAG: hypothetical protein P1V51_03455 [Deltaproteobacteria bacterium]|nr:hypothetical protein [Deltaproteobacteria bacterium]
MGLHAGRSRRGGREAQGVLYAILRCGKFRCALEAQQVEGFDAAAEGEPVLPLAERLGLPSLLPEGRLAEHVHLVGGGLPLLVDEVETILNPGSATVMELPTLTRLSRPVFRGVLCLEDGAILPVLDVEVLRAMDAEVRG